MNLEELQQAEVSRMNDAYYRLVDLVITLSTGAIALSITFRSSIVVPPAHPLWLKISWVAFIVAIIAGLCAQYAHHKRMANIFGLKEELPGRTVYLSWWANFAKCAMPVAFVAGIVAFAIFAWSSLD